MGRMRDEYCQLIKDDGTTLSVATNVATAATQAGKLKLAARAATTLLRHTQGGRSATQVLASAQSYYGQRDARGVDCEDISTLLYLQILAVMVTIALPPTVTLPTHDPFPNGADPERTIRHCLNDRALPASRSRASRSRAALVLPPSRQGDLEEAMPAQSGLIQVHPDWMRHEHVLVRQRVAHVAQYLRMYDYGGVVQELDELVMAWYDNTLRRIEGQLESKAEDAERLFKAATAAVLALLAAGAVALWHQLQAVM